MTKWLVHPEVAKQMLKSAVPVHKLVKGPTEEIESDVDRQWVRQAEEVAAEQLSK